MTNDAELLASAGLAPLERAVPLGGGCIAAVHRLHLTDGTSLVRKHDPHAEIGQFAAEAASLTALSDITGGPRIPAVRHQSETDLLLEDLAPRPPIATYWEDFARQLARLHDHHGPHFGFTCDTWCGATRQPNPATTDGHRFFAEHRLVYQARLARDGGSLSRQEATSIEAIANRLTDLIPSQPPSLVHGDLWSGNVLSDSNGTPALIDPSAHWGWAEADLGMTSLFGGFPEAFYAAYQAARPQVAGWQQRADVYQLYHLLNHLNLFGTSYHGQVMSIAKRLS